MFYSVNSIALVTTVLLSSVSALPHASPDPLLTRGANEVVYLANCANADAASHQSRMDYYANRPSLPKQPDDRAVLTSGSYSHWEGQAVIGKFDGSGATFTSRILSSADPHATRTTYAGTGSNSYGTNYNCYVDGGEYLHPGTTDASFKCTGIYYCTPT